MLEIGSKHCAMPYGRASPLRTLSLSLKRTVALAGAPGNFAPRNKLRFLLLGVAFTAPFFLPSVIDSLEVFRPDGDEGLGFFGINPLPRSRPSSVAHAHAPVLVDPGRW